MDAREKWLERGDALLVEAINSQYHLGQISGGNCVTMQQAIPSELAFDAIRAHLRTTPEGFALVPVERLRQLEDFVPVVSEYIDNYLQDERDEVDLCVCGEDQHSRLVDVFFSRDRLEKSKAPPPKSESL